MLKWSSFFAIFRNEQKLIVTLQTEKSEEWRVKSEEFTMRMEEVLHELPRMDHKLTIRLLRWDQIC